MNSHKNFVEIYLAGGEGILATHARQHVRFCQICQRMIDRHDNTSGRRVMRPLNVTDAVSEAEAILGLKQSEGDS